MIRRCMWCQGFVSRVEAWAGVELGACPEHQKDLTALHDSLRLLRFDSNDTSSPSKAMLSFLQQVEFEATIEEMTEEFTP